MNFELKKHPRSMPKKRTHCGLGAVDTSQECPFCGSNEDDEFLFGEFVHRYGISCHMFCMLLSSGLLQNGKERDGMYGFLLRDIQCEINRGSKFFCCYCRKKGATIGCCNKKCKKVFHLDCGQNQDALNQFFGDFKSYCKEHKPRQNENKIGKTKTFCHICFDLLSSKDTCIFSSCCKGDWFHKACLQKYALSAGAHHFKCPLCNNSDIFSKEMLCHGIYIPIKDAAWELEENAFHDQYPQNKCLAASCICPKGREYHKDSTIWSLISCSVCGSHETHKGCKKLFLSNMEWTCDDCKDIESRLTNGANLGRNVSGSVMDDSDSDFSASWSSLNSSLNMSLKPENPRVSFSDMFIKNDVKLNSRPVVVLKRLDLAQSLTKRISDTVINNNCSNCSAHGKCIMQFFSPNGKCKHSLHKLQNITNIANSSASSSCALSSVPNCDKKENKFSKIERASKSRKKKKNESQNGSKHKKFCPVKIDIFFKSMLEQYQTEHSKQEPMQ